MIRTRKSLLKALLALAFVTCLIATFALFMASSANAAEADEPIVVEIPKKDDTKYVYNGQQQSYKIATSDYYTISNNTKKINAGTYKIVVALKDGCVWSDGTTENLEYTFTIEKAPYYEIYDMKGVKFQNKFVVEDGKEHTLEISGDLPEGISVTYSPNKHTKVGSYQVIASFVGGNENYTQIPNMFALLVIRKASISAKLNEDDKKDTAIITSENGLDPRITELALESVSVDKNEKLLEVLGDDEKIVSAYSVKLMINEITYPLGENVTVKLLIPDELKRKDVNVYLLKDDGSITEMGVEKEGGYATFETERIAKFVVTCDEGQPYGWIWILLIIFAILVVVAVVVIMMIRVGKDENDDFDEEETRESKRSRK